MLRRGSYQLKGSAETEYLFVSFLHAYWSDGCNPHTRRLIFLEDRLACGCTRLYYDFQSCSLTACHKVFALDCCFLSCAGKRCCRCCSFYLTYIPSGFSSVRLSFHLIFEKSHQNIQFAADARCFVPSFLGRELQ